MTMEIMASSKSNEWNTPVDLYEKLDHVFHFTLDPCCTHDNALCEKHYTKEENGLAQSWREEIVFMNPPYGREIGDWIKKAVEESRHYGGSGATVVCLVPARTDTKWWQDWVFPNADEICFIRGRVKFAGTTEHGISSTGPAPFPSAIIVFRPGPLVGWLSTWDYKKTTWILRRKLF